VGGVVVEVVAVGVGRGSSSIDNGVRVASRLAWPAAAH